MKKVLGLVAKASEAYAKSCGTTSTWWILHQPKVPASLIRK